MGLRGKAMATLVASSNVVVDPAATIRGVNTSWGPSKVKAPSTPSSSRWRPWSPAPSRPASWVSIFMGPCSHPAGGVVVTPGPERRVRWSVPHWTDATDPLHADRGGGHDPHPGFDRVRARPGQSGRLL